MEVEERKVNGGKPNWGGREGKDQTLKENGKKVARMGSASTLTCAGPILS
jgi:hypothetical protein